MHIILGYELDTGSYPDALGNDEARQGIVVLGPVGLVGVLETRKTYGKETIRHREWPVHLRIGDQKAIEKATARPVMATMIHMPVLGVIMEVKIGDVVKLR